MSTRSVLITDAHYGFGTEIALYLAARGLHVYASLPDQDKSEALQEEALRRRVRVHALQLDLTDRAALARAVCTIVAESGGIYGLVNNASLILSGYFEDLTDAECRQVLEQTLFTTMAATREVLPYMRVAGNGRIVILSSIAGRIGGPTSAAYCAARFAQEGFAESLCQEVEPLGVGVSLIEPGITNHQSWNGARRSAAGARDPNSPNYLWYMQSERMFDKALRQSRTTPADVAAAAYRALTDARPRLRHVVGRQANAVVGLRAAVPDRVFERLYFGAMVRRVMGTAGPLVQSRDGR